MQKLHELFKDNKAPKIPQAIEYLTLLQSSSRSAQLSQFLLAFATPKSPNILQQSHPKEPTHHRTFKLQKTTIPLESKTTLGSKLERFGSFKDRTRDDIMRLLSISQEDRILSEIKPTHLSLNDEDRVAFALHEERERNDALFLLTLAENTGDAVAEDIDDSVAEDMDMDELYLARSAATSKSWR